MQVRADKVRLSLRISGTNPPTPFKSLPSLGGCSFPEPPSGAVLPLRGSETPPSPPLDRHEHPNLSELCVSVSTPACRRNVSAESLICGLAPVRDFSRQIVSTFPARVDITSKTWRPLPTCCYVGGERGNVRAGCRSAPAAVRARPGGGKPPRALCAGTDDSQQL